MPTAARGGARASPKATAIQPPPQHKLSVVAHSTAQTQKFFALGHSPGYVIKENVTLPARITASSGLPNQLGGPATILRYAVYRVGAHGQLEDLPVWGISMATYNKNMTQIEQIKARFSAR